MPTGVIEGPTPDLINLDPDSQVDDGVERKVFVHPADDKRLIKIIKQRHKEDFNR